MGVRGGGRFPGTPHPGSQLLTLQVPESQIPSSLASVLQSPVFSSQVSVAKLHPLQLPLQFVAGLQVTCAAGGRIVCWACEALAALVPDALV